MGNDVPVTGQSSGVMTFRRYVTLTVTESEPGSSGPAPLLVALVMTLPARQWNVTLMVPPLITEPAAVPLLELSSDAMLTIDAIGLPPGGIAVVTVTAEGPPAPAQTASAVECCAGETAMRSAWRAELVTASR